MFTSINKTDSVYIKRSNNDWICILCNGNLFPFNHFDRDIDFLNCLSANTETNQRITLDILQSKVFNPFEFNSDNESFIDDIDPDVNFYNALSQDLSYNSDYYLSDKFKNKCIEKGFNSDCFSFIHLNIRSVPKNINQFELYLRNIQHEFSIIGLSETWLNESNFSLYNIVGYNHVYKYREKKSGGGVSMYIKESLHYTSREDLSIFNNIIESVFIEIQKDNFNTPHNILIGTIYRPPNKDIKLFY